MATPRKKPDVSTIGTDELVKLLRTRTEAGVVALFDRLDGDATEEHFTRWGPLIIQEALARGLAEITDTCDMDGDEPARQADNGAEEEDDED